MTGWNGKSPERRRLSERSFRLLHLHLAVLSNTVLIPILCFQYYFILIEKKRKAGSKTCCSCRNHLWVSFLFRSPKADVSGASTSTFIPFSFSLSAHSFHSFHLRVGPVSHPRWVSSLSPKTVSGGSCDHGESASVWICSGLSASVCVCVCAHATGDGGHFAQCSEKSFIKAVNRMSRVFTATLDLDLVSWKQPVYSLIQLVDRYICG